MRKFATALVAAVALACAAAAPGHAAPKANTKTHHIAIQVDQNNPAVMNLVLNNVANLMQYYQDKGETADIEVVAYGPGLMMLRADKSPVKGRLANLKKIAFPSTLTFSACHNTMMNMEKKEGHAIPIVSQARVVPAGVVRLTQLQEQGWVYIRP
jgi:uncharacterized protein